MDSDVVSGSLGETSKYTQRSFATWGDVRKILQFYSEHNCNGKKASLYGAFPAANKRWVLNVISELEAAGLLENGGLMDIGIAYLAGMEGDKKSCNSTVFDAHGCDTYRFEKRKHGGIKAVHGDNYLDVLRMRGSAAHKKYFDSEYVTAMMIKHAPGAGLAELREYLALCGNAPWVTDHWLRAFEPKRDVFDYKRHALTGDCEGMLAFVEKTLLGSSIFDESNGDARYVSLDEIGTVYVPPKKHLRNQVIGFRTFLSGKKRYPGKNEPESSDRYVLKCVPEKDPDKILRLEVIKEDGSDRKVFITNGKPTPLGREFYSYCISEPQAPENKSNEEKYRLCGVLGMDGNLTKNGADIMSVLIVKSK